MRRYAGSPQVDQEYRSLMERMDEEEYCNLCITLIHQATYLLRQLIAAQQKQFLEQGGVREQMTRARLEYRKRQ